MGRPQRKAAKPATTGPNKGASSSKQQTATNCIKCGATSSLVNLKQDVIAQELYVHDELEPGQNIHACISCAYHASLVAQLQSALQDQMKRPTTSCLVCRSSGRLQELHSLEGCKEGLMNPIIQSPHVTVLLSNSRKLCIPCAYSIQWLYTHSLECKPKTRNSKAKPNKPETKVATKKVKEPSPPPEPRSKRGRPALEKPQVAQNQKTKKPPPRAAPRSLRKRAQTPSSSEEEEEEEVKEPPKKKAVPVTTNSRTGRVSKPPERLNAAQKLEVKNKTSKTAKPPAPQRASKRPQRAIRSKNYAETDEPIEVTCSLCSDVFNSQVKLAVHELEHNNRTLQIILTRCKEIEEPDSSAPYQQFSSSEDDDLNDKQRSRRKNKSPKKNLARDEVTDENDKRHNFVFVSPVLVSNQKKIADPTVTFSFEKPIVCKDVESSGDFSEEEQEESDNVSKCITSLENETKDSDDAEKDEQESTDLSEKETSAEDNPTMTEGNEPSNNEDLEKNMNEEENQTEEPEINASDAEAEMEATANGHHTSEQTESPVLTSNVLKFDFDDAPKKSAFAVPPKNPLTVNSILSFDYEAPVKRVSDGSKIIEQDVGGVNANVSFDSTGESGDGTQLEPQSALREDSVNPTLPQTQDSDPNCSFSSVDSRANESAEFTGLEKMISEVVGEN